MRLCDATAVSQSVVRAYAYAETDGSRVSIVSDTKQCIMIPRCPARTVQVYCFLCECAEKSNPLQSCCVEGPRCPPYTQEKQQKKRTEAEGSAGLGLHWSRKRWVYTQAGAGSVLKPNATKSRAEKTRVRHWKTENQRYNRNASAVGGQCS